MTGCANPMIAADEMLQCGQLELWGGVLLRDGGGMRRAEQVLRAELSNGEVQYFEGELGAERVVRLELPNGEVHYFEGERGSERMVSKELLGGDAAHLAGGQGGGLCLGAYDGHLDRSVRQGRPRGLPRVAEGARAAGVPGGGQARARGPLPPDLDVPVPQRLRL